MKNIKKTLAIGLASTILFAPAFAKDDLETKANYRIYCDKFQVGKGHYITKENNEKYEIIMEAWSTGLFKFLGIEYAYFTEGYKRGEELYPEHFKKISQSESTKTEKPNAYPDDDTTRNHNRKLTKIRVTDIYFDYEKLESKIYAYKEEDGKKEIRHDTRNKPAKITKDVKDFLTLIEDLKRKKPDNYEIKTITERDVHSFKIKKIGEETIKLNNELYETLAYKINVNKDEVKIWIHKEKDHTILKVWVEDGPLWTSVNVLYSGKKSELR